MKTQPPVPGEICTLHPESCWILLICSPPRPMTAGGGHRAGFGDVPKALQGVPNPLGPLKPPSPDPPDSLRPTIPSGTRYSSVTVVLGGHQGVTWTQKKPHEHPKTPQDPSTPPQIPKDVLKPPQDPIKLTNPPSPRTPQTSLQNLQHSPKKPSKPEDLPRNPPPPSRPTTNSPQEPPKEPLPPPNTLQAPWTPIPGWGVDGPHRCRQRWGGNLTCLWGSPRFGGGSPTSPQDPPTSLPPQPLPVPRPLGNPPNHPKDSRRNTSKALKPALDTPKLPQNP